MEHQTCRSETRVNPRHCVSAQCSSHDRRLGICGCACCGSFLRGGIDARIDTPVTRALVASVLVHTRDTQMALRESDDDQGDCHARLFDAKGADRRVACGDIAELELEDHHLLWIDLRASDEKTCETIWAALSLPRTAYADLRSGGTTPILGKSGDCFWVRVVAVSGNDGLALQGQVLMLVATRNTVISLHDEPIAFVTSLARRESAGSDLGALCAESFVAALLDWHLATYFDAAADFEMAIERLEVGILAEQKRDSLPEMRRLRKAASRLRRMLAPHRAVFAGMSRPDFRSHALPEAVAHLVALDTRYERAMDMVENSRDLVVGTFQLFTSQVALQTNTSMRLLSFIAVVVGALAVIAGILGMNFDAPFFKTQGLGFWIAVTSMLVLATASIVVAKVRRWL